MKQNVCVVVLGDIGRSPRMQYHSVSFSQRGNTVDVVGYCETDPPMELKNNSQIYLHYLVPCPAFKYVPRFLNYVLKTVWQFITLVFVFLMIRKPNVIIVQNPPAIPALIVCWIYSIVVKAKLIIDWHNYAHTIMALSLGLNNILVKTTRIIEFYIGQKTLNLCVTNAMQKDLLARGIKATTLYDRPSSIFRSITLTEKHDFLMKLGRKYDIFLSNDGNTKFTSLDNVTNQVTLKTTRPGLLISSTSWTADEDFSILLLALQEYENHCLNGNLYNLPELICIITGKGPLKTYYKKEIMKKQWKYVSCLTPWLESADYPLLLASCDLGVCLHFSSSGFDLPMKVVDMFGCGLPVCAINFKCLNELLQNGINGYIFKDGQELSTQLLVWFSNFPSNLKQQEIEKTMKTKLSEFQNLRWEENWTKTVTPLF